MGEKKTDFLLEVFTNLIVGLELLVKLIQFFLVDITGLQSILSGRNGRAKEVEERFGWASLSNQTRTVGI